MSKNKRSWLYSVFLVVVTQIITSCALAYDSPSNGVYGGYVGSDQWFNSMRQSAANQAMIQSLHGKGGGNKLPADYIEFAGQISFPQGNPFPKGKIPDLRIVCRDKNADAIERAPHVDKDGNFYTPLKKGQTYDLYWMYYFGSKEKFATLNVQAKGPNQRKANFEYVAKKSTQNFGNNHSSGKSGGSSLTSSQNNPTSQLIPYQPPKVGPGYIPPNSSPYKPPKTDSSYHAPGNN
ncbi:MAG: hypothetical protein HQM08_27470 [Candidatus Riflebacteria bacterium]|nr:hypothetical protein [Candidatus Riflebacteria bacterium]